MPLPISTTLIFGALALSQIATAPLKIVVYVFVGLAVANELLRMWVSRQPTNPDSYAIPAARQRTPIEYDAS